MTLIAEPTEPLWTRARAMYARAVAAIGDAAAIARLVSLSRTLRREIAGRLCLLECIVRRLLIAEAADIRRAEIERAKRGVRVQVIQLRTLGLANVFPRTPALQARHLASVKVKSAHDLSAETQRAQAEDARSKPDTSRPETWRASFSFALPRDPHVVSNARAPRIRALWGPPPPPEPPPRAPRLLKPEDAPFRLARRFEALRRVLQDPRPYAERLARILPREVRRFRHVVPLYVSAPSRTNFRDPRDYRLGIDAMGAAYVREEAFKDSS